MASRSVCHDLPNQLTTLLRFGVVGDLSDGQLVQRFLTARDGADQAAFTALVERHGPMVLGVCREVLGNAQDAEDAFQATFLVLARKAGSVRKADSLASWLHSVARRVAMRAKAEAARRRAYERRSAAMKAVTLERQEDPPEGWPELHEAIARLPERYREPVVLCYLEGLTTEEASLRIGCPIGTILSRLSRARERLRGQLERHSLASPTILVTTGFETSVYGGTPGGSARYDCPGGSRIRGETDERGRPGFRLGDDTGERGASYHGHFQAERSWARRHCPAASPGAARSRSGSSAASAASRRSYGATAEQRQAALDRSMNKLQFELDESVRRNNEIQKALQDIRAELEALRAGQQPPPATKAASRLAPAIHADSAQGVSRLAEALKRHPVRPSGICTLLRSGLHDGSCRGRDDHHRRRTGTGSHQLWYGQVVA